MKITIPLAVLLMVSFTQLPAPAQRDLAYGAPGYGVVDNSVIRFRQSGGFAGVNRTARVRIASLSGQERRQFVDAIRQSGILRMQSARRLNPNAADVFVYEINVSDRWGPGHNVVFDDTTLPDNFRPLVTLLQRHAGDGSQPAPPTGQLQVIDKGTYSGIRSCQQTVIRDQFQWRQLWRQHYSYRRPSMPLPQIDFSRHMLIAVFAGTKRMGGYSVSVSDVQARRNRLVVTTTLTSPTPDMMVTQARTQPFEIVQVPRFDGQVVFANDICNLADD